jgi:diaminopimelate decarboxylase
MPGLAQNSLVGICCAGAYGASMASFYNSRPLIPEILVSGDSYHVIRRRITNEEILATSSVPSWLIPNAKAVVTLSNNM